MIKKTLIAALAVVFVHAAAEACTGLYVGKKVSVEGNPLIARTIDSADMYSTKSLHVFPRYENTPGRVHVGGWERGGTPMPATTWKFVSTPVVHINRSVRYDSACVNEKGLAISGTVTGWTSPAAKKADPFVRSGYGESSVVGYLAMSCTKAREAVKRFGELIAEKGHDGAEIYVFADAEECWYMEVYTGHQWAAIKMPEDKVVVIGNQFMIREFDPAAPDVMSSPDLVKLPVEKGFAVKGPGGHLDLVKTYADKRIIYSNIRTWFGHKYFAPNDDIGEFKVDAEYPLFFTPERKLSKHDLFALMRSRYEGTEYCPEETGNFDVRVIATARQSACHVLEVDADLPEDRRAILWTTMANAEHCPFLPVSATIDVVDPAYSLLSTDKPRVYNDGLAAHSFRRLAVLAETDRKMLGAGVRSYWEALEKKWAREFPLLLEEGNVEKLNNYCLDIQERALADARKMFDEVTWYNVFHCLKKGDSFRGTVAEKKPYVYSRANRMGRIGPGFVAIAPAAGKGVAVDDALVKKAVAAGLTPIVLPHLDDTRRIEAVLDIADAVVIAPGADDAFTKLVRAMAARRGIRVLGE